MSCEAGADPDITPPMQTRPVPVATLPPSLRFENTDGTARKRRRSHSTRRRMRRREELTPEGFLLLGTASDNTSDEEADVASPTAPAGHVDLEASDSEGASPKPKLPPLQAETARADTSPTPVPVFFKFNTARMDWDITWQWPGTIEERSVLERDGGRQYYLHEDPFKIPEDVVAVITRRVKPIRYPIGCPVITAEILATEEKKGDEWLRDGRVAFIDGLRDGTIPLHATRSHRNKPNPHPNYTMLHRSVLHSESCRSSRKSPHRCIIQRVALLM